MDLNRFTEKSQEALHSAQALAARRNHQGVDVEHLLAALLEEPEGLAAALLAAAGIAPSTLERTGAGTQAVTSPVFLAAP